MSIDDHVDNELEDRKIFLQELIDNDDLDGAAHWITKKVIAGGEDGLTPEQKLVFKRNVLGNFVTEKCRNGHGIPWPEKYKALHNGGFCFHCYDRMTRYRDQWGSGEPPRLASG